jgi:DNA-3-methyladenine glycosylase II
MTREEHRKNKGSISLSDLILQNGAPTIYHSIPCRHGDSAVQDLKKPGNCFESLCRIIAGQQLAGAAAQSVWKRLLETTNQNLTPATILSLAKENVETNLQKPAGLSGAKARSIVDLSHHFQDGKLNETLLISSTEETVRSLLLNVKGLGPWSCDMFLMFYLERSDIFPVGDLGVRKGVARHFQLSGSSLCAKKDLGRMLEIAAPYQPYRSLLSYYMWKAADITDFYNDGKDKRISPKKQKNAA